MPARPKVDAAEFLKATQAGTRVTDLMRQFHIARTSVIRRLRLLGLDTSKPCESMGWAGHAVYYMPNHPRARQSGQVLRCIVLWEMAHGKPFPEGKEPHHKDLDKLNDDPTNIQPLTHSEHSSLHYKLRGRRGKFKRLEH